MKHAGSENQLGCEQTRMQKSERIWNEMNIGLNGRKTTGAWPLRTHESMILEIVEPRKTGHRERRNTKGCTATSNSGPAHKTETRQSLVGGPGRPTKSPAQNSDFPTDEIKGRAEEEKQISSKQKPEAVMDEAN
jgi:hypothetical protein